MDVDFSSYSATSLVTGLCEQAWTSLELTIYFLNRIEKGNPGLNAVPFIYREEAIAQAKASDSRRKSGHLLSRLDGLPMTLKDAIKVAGQKSTYGIWFLRNYIPSKDSTLIAVLRKSGIIFLGRTAVPTAAFDWNCRNFVYKECVNPFDPLRTPGGSSGGAAAALAASMTPLELGSDIAGSIRYPAHCCGVYGLRTTDGWLPIADVGPEQFPTSFQQLVTFGPMARCLEDLDLLLEPFELAFPKLNAQTPAADGKKLNIAYSKALLGVQLELPTDRLYDSYLEKLKSDGHEMVEAAPALNFEGLYRDWGIIAGFEYTSLIPRWLRNTLVKRLYSWWMLDRRIGAGDFSNGFRHGMLASHDEYQQACNRRSEVYSELELFFRAHQLWILPVSPSAAVMLSECGKNVKTSYGNRSYSALISSYLVPTTMLGTPAVALPIGIDENEMPIGVQIHGPRYSDRWLVQTLDRNNFAPGSLL